MAHPLPSMDYETLASIELEKAAASATRDQRRNHLDQAAIFATLSEQQRFNRAGTELQGEAAQAGAIDREDC